MANLSQRQNFTIRRPIINLPIYEYDITAAGFSMIREFKLLPKEDRQYLATLTKRQRNIEIGMMTLKNRQLLREIEKNLKQVMLDFRTKNDIQESDIVSIKRDALYTLKRAKHLNFGKYIKFRKESKYSSFQQLAGKEFYYSSWDDVMTIKGLSKEVITKHEQFLLKDIKAFMKLAESLSPSSYLIKLDQYRKKYIEKELPIQTYCHLADPCGYLLNSDLSLSDLVIENDGVDINEIDISFNYMSVIVPLIQNCV
jgi:hypothetical protein